MMRIKSVFMTIVLAGVLPFAACSQSPEEAQRAAMIEQQKANQTAAAAQNAADAKGSAAENTAQQVALKAELNAADIAQKAQAKADQAAAKATLVENETYDQFASRSATDLTTVERRATEIDKSAQNLGPQAQARANVVVNDVKAKGATIRQDVKTSSHQTGDALAATKAKVGRSLNDLTQELDDYPTAM